MELQISRSSELRHCPPRTTYPTRRAPGEVNQSISYLHTVEENVQGQQLAIIVDKVRDYLNSTIQPSLTPASLNFLLWVPAALSMPVA